MNATKQDVFVSYARSEASNEPILARLAGAGLVVWYETATILPFPPPTGASPKEENVTTGASPLSEQQSHTRVPGPGGDVPGGDPPIDWHAKRLIDMSEVLQKIPVTRQTIFNWEKSGAFPRRVVLPNGMICWLESEVHDWIDDRTRNGINE